MHQLLARALIVSAGIGLLGMPAAAQFDQYMVPGSTGERPTSLLEQMDEAYEEARWTLGPLKLDPWLGVRDASYVDNAFGSDGDPVEDVTATLGAGLRAFLPIGPEAYLAVHALPEYVWWDKLEERRRWDGRYGVGIFASLSRLDLVVEASRSESQRIVTPELLQQVHQRIDQASLSLELDLYRSLRLFVAASERGYENLSNLAPGGAVPDLSDLDRDEQVLRAGVAMRLGSRVRLAVGAEDSEVEFALGAPIRDRSNEGLAPTLGLTFEGNKLFFRLDAAQRSLDPIGSSSFPGFDSTTGRAQLQLGGERTRLDLYHDRSLTYTLGTDFAFFESEISGVAVGFAIGRRFRLRLFQEVGDNDYAMGSEVVTERIDDVQNRGVGLSFEVPWAGRLSFDLLEIDIESDIPGFDRKVQQAGFTFSLGPILGWP